MRYLTRNSLKTSTDTIDRRPLTSAKQHFAVDRKLIWVSLTLILMPLVYVTAFLLPNHNPRANGLRIAVVGPGSVARPLVRAMGNVDIVAAPDARTAIGDVRSREVYGAIVSGSRPRVVIATAASFVVASEIRQAAARADVDPAEISDVAPLPAGDPRGVALNLMVLALLITSITGASLAAQVLNLRAGPRELHAVIVALIVGIGTAAILHAFNALPGSLMSEAALFAAMVFSVALVAAALARFSRPAGATVAFLVFVVLANPASGLTSAPALLPTPWMQLGQWFPPGALGSALRGVAYFGDAGIWGPIVVLVTWMVIGVALNALLDRRHPSPAQSPMAPLPDGVQAAIISGGELAFPAATSPGSGL